MLDVRIFHNAKFGALSNRAKLGWVYLLCEAKQQDREGLFPSRAGFLLGAGPFRDCAGPWLEAGMVHYAEAICPKCSKVFGAVPSTAVVVHDWHEYQPSRTTLWREENGLDKHGKQPRNNGETPGETVSETSGETAVKPLRARTRASLSLSSESPTEEEPTTVSADGYPAPGSDRDALDTYHELTRWRPWGAWSGKALSKAIVEYTNPAVDAALRHAYDDDPDRDTLMDRAFAKLARDAEKAKAARPKPRLIRPVRDEAAVKAELRRLMEPGATA